LGFEEAGTAMKKMATNPRSLLIEVILLRGGRNLPQ
jgi:hypothetical protein